MKLVDEKDIELFIAGCHATIDAQGAILKQHWKDVPGNVPTPDPVPVPKPTTIGEAAMARARLDIGIKEATGNNDGAGVKKFQDFVGTWAEGEPWCACATSYWIYKGAEDIGYHLTKFVKSASSSEIYAHAKANGTLLDKPEGICIALEIAPPGSGKTHEHTCLANCLPENFKDGQETFASIDGNWSNSVCRPNPPHKVANFHFVRIA